ncbi:hypothetical protein CEXT_285971 [Caerostris extrusa]|uniref:Uncharacterized protein n=1 Tax=Caerostris extrusa TaxID=172846 RepID=A0AAV4SNT5_CAEEX|nr:hypothetical protein CEXT_285971 [Caerostris extrusa]
MGCRRKWVALQEPRLSSVTRRFSSAKDKSDAATAKQIMRLKLATFSLIRVAMVQNSERMVKYNFLEAREAGTEASLNWNDLVFWKKKFHSDESNRFMISWYDLHKERMLANSLLSVAPLITSEDWAFQQDYPSVNISCSTKFWVKAHKVKPLQSLSRNPTGIQWKTFWGILA